MWSEEQTQILQKEYSYSSISDLCRKLGKTKTAIHQKAYRLKLKSNNLHNKKCDFRFLLEDSCEAFYWIGYLLADGSFKRSKTISALCAEKDVPHLKRLAELSGANLRSYVASTGERYYTVCGNDITVIPKICSKFDIKTRKTFNPPNFAQYNFADELLICMFIGFIAGDGSISEAVRGSGRFRMAIEVHKSWFNNLNLMNSKMHEFFGIECKSTTQITKRGYAYIKLGNQLLLKRIKHYIEEKQLPMMQRKWSHIKGESYEIH